ncbi:spindle assembly checkpoint component Mad1 [Chytriomyces cf. hyalinus JEL632]|nr:spindle assembly checkpoint component Mad1 [Chytriomyces cf. hyalinus JEL632]
MDNIHRRSLFKPSSSTSSSSVLSSSQSNPSQTTLNTLKRRRTPANTLATPSSSSTAPTSIPRPVSGASITGTPSSSVPIFSRLHPASLDDVLNTLANYKNASQDASSNPATPRNPNNRKNNAPNSNSTPEPTELRQLQLELLDANKRIKAFERDLSNATSDAEKKLIALDCDKKNVQLQLAQALSKIQKLEEDRVFLLERDKSQSQKLKQAEKELALKGDAENSNASKLQSENHALAEKCALIEEKLLEVEHRRDFDLANLSNDLKRAQTRVEMVSRQLQEESKSKALALSHVADLQMKVSELESGGDESHFKRNSHGTEEIIQKQLDDQLKHIHLLETAKIALTKEVTHLRSLRESTATLQETNRSLQHQLAQCANLRERFAEAQVEAMALKAEKQRWTSLLKDSDFRDSGGDEITPLSLARLLSAERLERARDKERVVEDKSRMKVLEASVLELEKEVESLKQTQRNLEAKADTQIRVLKRVEMGRDFAVREAQFLREQMKSMQFDEETGFGQEAATNRTAELEELLKDYKSHLQALETELAAIKASTESSGSGKNASTTREPDSAGPLHLELLARVQELENELNSLTADKAVLEKEVENFDQQIVVLERAIGQGAFDRANLKVLQLADNPETQAFAIRKEKLDALEAENKALQARLLGSEWGALVPVEIVKTAEMECQRLMKLIEERDKRILRLREVFSEKSQEFKEAVFSLLGYKVEFQESRVRLMSTFSDENGTDPSFLFTSQENDHGTLQIVGGHPDRIQQLNQLRECYIVQHGSVPAFLASVTLKGWEEGHMVG